MAPLKERLSIDFLKGGADSAQYSATAAPHLEQALAAVVTKALSDQAGRQSDIATLAKQLGIKFSTLVPLVENLAAQGTLKYVSKDPVTDNHVVQL